MKFPRVYIEITNVCGLQCDFCPPKTLPNATMGLEDFIKVIQQIKSYTKEIALHIVGDPLILPNLNKYLKIVEENKLRVMLTTSGFFIEKHLFKDLFSSGIKQINISLNSYNKNAMKISLEEFLKPILDLCKFKMSEKKKQFINLRLWNINSLEDREFNESVFKILNGFFHSDLDYEKIFLEKPKFVRVEDKIRVHFDEYFQWPDLRSGINEEGTCQGLTSHFGVLADLSVVPCCLDKDGIVHLGDLKVKSLEEILAGARVEKIRKGFQEGRAVEDLCKSCQYKRRFKK